MKTAYWVRLLSLSLLLLSARSFAAINIEVTFQVNEDCNGARDTVPIKVAFVQGQPIIVGSCGPQQGAGKGFFGHPAIGFTLVEFEPGNSNALTGINSSGQKVGFASSVDGTTRSYVLQFSEVTPITVAGCGNVSASSVTEDGVIAGGCDSRSFIRYPNGQADLYGYPGAQQTMFKDLVWDALPQQFFTVGYVQIGGRLSGLLGSPPGSLTPYDHPNSLATAFLGTDAQHTAVGTYLGGDLFFHGLVKQGDNVVTLDVPGADAAITGVQIDSTGRELFVGYIDDGFNLSGFIARQN